MTPTPRSTVRRASGTVGALAVMTALTVLTGVLVTIMVTPIIAVAGQGASFGVRAFDFIPEALEIGQQAQTSGLYATRAGEPVKIAEFFSQDRQDVGWDDIPQGAKEAAIATEGPALLRARGR